MLDHTLTTHRMISGIWNPARFALLFDLMSMAILYNSVALFGTGLSELSAGLAKHGESIK